MKTLFKTILLCSVLSWTAHAVPVSYVQVSTTNTSSVLIGGIQGYVLLYSSTVYFVAVSSATTAAAYVPTSTKITITPTRSTSRVEVSWVGQLSTGAGSTANGFASIFRGTSNLAPSGGTDLCIADAGVAGSSKATCAGDVIDLPNTTSATTYTIYIRNDSAGTTITWGGQTASGASITVKEWGY